MSTEMSDEELETARRTATLVEEGGYDSEKSGDEDDYVIASLYKTPDGRYFRYIEQTGMNSPFDGSGEIGEWLDAAEVTSWNQFD